MEGASVGTSVGTIFGVWGLTLFLFWVLFCVRCFSSLLFSVVVSLLILFFFLASFLLLSFEKADLLHSTEYKVRVASSSPQGIFSPYSTTELGRTQKPTPPTEPRDTAMVSATGGAIFHQWRRPYDTGG